MSLEKAGKLLGKLDPQQIFELATSVVYAKRDLSEMKIKADAFVGALTEHEKSSRIAIAEQTKQFEIVVEALKESIPLLEDSQQKLEAIKLLAEYGSHSISELGRTSRDILTTIPIQPKMLD